MRFEGCVMRAVVSGENLAEVVDVEERQVRGHEFLNVEREVAERKVTGGMEGCRYSELDAEVLRSGLAEAILLDAVEEGAEREGVEFVRGGYSTRASAQNWRINQEAHHLGKKPWDR